jgi:hypothetical protein
MTAKNKTESDKSPAIRDLQGDEVDSVSGGAGTKTPGWIEPDINPVESPKSPGWTDPDSQPVR